MSEPFPTNDKSSLILPKLLIPHPPKGVVPRPELYQRLEAGATGKVVVVVAPAGFGKTVLVSTWAHSKPAGDVAWVALDKRDSDRSRFWRYLLAALARVGIEVATSTRRFALAGQTTPSEVALSELVNTLADLSSEVTLVLDDLHLVTSAQVDADLSFLLDHAPPQLHLVILTRTDPSFLPSRRTASGEVVEFRARDLAFSRGEVLAFVTGQGASLADERTASLFASLRGWPAAVRLATVYLSQRHDLAGLPDFASGNTVVADYFITEVLAQLPPDVRLFLLRTSILPRLAGSLCDAVTGQRNGTATLQEVADQGMFIEPLGPGRTWYQYHQLIAELLRDELSRDDPDLLTELHRRASAWFARHGFPGDAIEHGLLAEDWSGVRALLIQQVLSVGSSHHVAVIEGWLSRLPLPTVEISPVLLLLRAFVLAQTGHLSDARVALDDAERRGLTPGADGEPQEFQALLHAVKAGIARLDCDLDEARLSWWQVKKATQPVGDALLTELAAMATAAADNALAATMFWHGHIGQVEQILDNTERQRGHQRLIRMRVSTMSAKSLLLATTGRLRGAEALVNETFELATPARLDGLFQTNPALLAKAIVAFQRSLHDAAQDQLTVIDERARRHGDRAPVLAVATLQARLVSLSGDTDEALAILDRASSTWPEWSIPLALRAMMRRETARICLMAGDLGAARAVHAELRLLDGDAPFTVLAAKLTEARLLGSDGRYAESATLFETCANFAITNGQLVFAIEALVDAASASGSLDEGSLGNSYLSRALELAADEAIVGPFVRAAERVRPGILRMELEGASGPWTFRRQLLELMGVPATFDSVTAGRLPARKVLTDREMIVLRLLQGNLSNQKIAEAMAVSPNTLKTHIRNIYRKLGADNRREAVVRAQELYLLRAERLP